MIALPGIVYLLINNYIPMFGIFLAFKNYSLRKGVFGSDWCGLQNFCSRPKMLGL
jgi:putative aldouronate transport system permease protein